MTNKKRIACFFTCGFTELNALKLFFNKVNDEVIYTQLCPTGPRKSKKQITGRHTDTIDVKQNGLTGSSLTNFVIDFVGKNRFAEERYDAILIEDDKDNRFLEIQEDGTANVNMCTWNAHREAITNAIHSKYPNIPVFFVYAAPEVEAWFIADWENGFGKVYEDNFRNHNKNQFFSVNFKKYVERAILTSRYVGAIETYGYFDGEYRKLSEEIQNALASEVAAEFCIVEPDETELNLPRYSKRVEGERMLGNINPDKLLEKCPLFLRDQLICLRNFK